jgi:hypothetical protein
MSLGSLLGRPGLGPELRLVVVIRGQRDSHRCCRVILLSPRIAGTRQTRIKITTADSEHISWTGDGGLAGAP